MSSFRVTVLRLVLALGLSFAMWAFVSFSQNFVKLFFERINKTLRRLSPEFDHFFDKSFLGKTRHFALR